jgi:uncharacterized protein YcbK (DUF882 family)
VKLPELRIMAHFGKMCFTVKPGLRVIDHIARQQKRRSIAAADNKQSQALHFRTFSPLRLPTVRLGKAAAVIGAGLMMAVIAVRPTQDAVAQGGTRSLTIYHAHTKEQETVTFRSGGSYDSAGLQKLNWLLRDWRQDEPTRMDPRLFDILWEVYRASGSSSPIHVVSAYRSPGTNAMLARRSRGVAKNSQHMNGRAMDFNLPDVSMATVRDIGLRMQNGGVGYYPRANNPWVHLDTGGVRHWPKVSRDHLVRLFPDEKTVHIPRDGKPLAGFEAARSIIEARGGSVSSGYIDIAEGRATGKTLFQILFGGGEGDDDSDVVAGNRGKKGRTAVAARSRNQQVAALPPETVNENSAVAFFSQNTTSTSSSPRAETPAAATRARAPSRPTPLPDEPPPGVKTEEPKPTAVAALVPAPAAPAAAPARKADDSEADEGRWVTIPLPQRRPTSLAAAGPVLVNIPLPQRRPATLLAAASSTQTDGDRTADPAKAQTAQAEPAKPVQTAALGRPVNIPLPSARPANLPSAITAGLRTGNPGPASSALAYAPAQPAQRIIPAAVSTPAAIDRQGMNSLISQVATASNPARGSRVAPQSVAAVAAENGVKGRFETAPAAAKLEDNGFTGSVIRPIGAGFR